MIGLVLTRLTKNSFVAYFGYRFRRIFQQDFETLKIRIGQQSVIAAKALRPSLTKLSDAEVTVFSQWGEDGILDYLCDIAMLDRPNVLELGAGNFEECNSRFLVENRLANSVLVDARNDLIPYVKSAGVYWKTHMLAINSWITPETIRGIQSDAKAFLGHIDIVSIDIDGNDYWVMNEFDFSDLTIVVAEYNPLFGSVFPVTIPRDDSFIRSDAHHSNLYYGVGILAWVKFFEARGFALAGTNKVGSNAFFIRSHLISKLDFVPNADLTAYTNWGVRESRAENGKLNFLSGDERGRAISHLELLNVETGEMQRVGECK